MKCVTLPDTCVEILPIPFADALLPDNTKALNSTWRRLRATPLKLHVGGLDAAELTKRRAAIGGAVVNPMFPERLRHLEADIVPTPSRPNFPWQQNNLIAVWPPWEQGFGDAFGGTLLPLGELSRLGELEARAGPLGAAPRVARPAARRRRRLALRARAAAAAAAAALRQRVLARAPRVHAAQHRHARRVRGEPRARRGVGLAAAAGGAAAAIRRGRAAAAAARADRRTHRTAPDCRARRARRCVRRQRRRRRRRGGAVRGAARRRVGRGEGRGCGAPTCWSRCGAATRSTGCGSSAAAR